MLASKYRALVVVGIALGLAALACGQFTPPESCGAGGTADPAKFAEQFTAMELINQATGQPGALGSEGEPQFASTDQLIIQVESVTEVQMRTCVEERRGGGKIAFDQTLTAPQGPSSLSIGSFKPGSYVVRVIVDSILVKNLPFLIK